MMKFINIVVAVFSTTQNHLGSPSFFLLKNQTSSLSSIIYLCSFDLKIIKTYYCAGTSTGSSENEQSAFEKIHLESLTKTIPARNTMQIRTKKRARSSLPGGEQPSAPRASSRCLEVARDRNSTFFFFFFAAQKKKNHAHFSPPLSACAFKHLLFNGDTFTSITGSRLSN